MTRHLSKKEIVAGLMVGFVTFFIALVVSLGSEALMKIVNNFILAFLMLFLIIGLGIFFDLIGTAATAAELPPFNARAAKKVYGAAQAVRLLKNASKVANYCNDVIGDICGTVSGAIGAGIVFSLVDTFSIGNIVLVSAVMTSFIAATTVGGKAIGKSVALTRANQIIFQVALVIAWWENLTGIKLFDNRR